MESSEPGSHPLDGLRARLTAGEAVVAGVLSGTSADGIDCALCRLHPRPGRVGPPELLAFRTVPFESELGARVRRVLDAGHVDARALALLGRDLGRAFGRAVRGLADEAGLAVDLVGSHGQTVYHHDGREESGAATLQLGEESFLAAEAGAPVVGDFRQADLAAGGEGAPLSATCDDELFQALERPAAILNLGGIANLTLLGESATPPLAFDTGPANRLLDGLALGLLDRPYDADGRTALAGRANAALIERLASHPFLAAAPPKSTGRDTFGSGYVDGVLALARSLELGAADVLASAVRFVALSVADALSRFAPEAPRVLVLAGGGARNRALVGELARATRVETVISSTRGVDPDAREALVFAMLAGRWVLAIPSTEPRVSGARPGRILGKLCLGTTREPPISRSGRSFP